MRYAPPHVPPSAGGTELARCENRTEPLFPKVDEPKRLPDGHDPPEGPCPGDALPVDQANPNSVDWTLQRISRSRKRVTVLRQKHVRSVKPNPVREVLPCSVRRLGDALEPRRAFSHRCLSERSAGPARKDTVAGPVSPHSSDDVAAL